MFKKKDYCFNLSNIENIYRNFIDLYKFVNFNTLSKAISEIEL